MKKMQLVIGAAIAISGFSACGNSSDAVKKDANDLFVYVDSVDKMEPVYTTTKWTTIEAGYNDRVMKTDKNVAVLQEEDKQKVDEAKVKYEALKLKYQTAIKEKEQAAKKPDYKMVLRTNLFGEGKIGTDMSFKWVTADNIKDVYEKFVNTVSDNKDKYTREDWDEIKTLYEALDSRKNEVEKDLATKDNLKIAGLKIKFAAIKSVERPLAKVKENEKAKDK